MGFVGGGGGWFRSVLADESLGTQASAMLLNYSWLFEGFGVINVGHGGGIG